MHPLVYVGGAVVAYLYIKGRTARNSGVVGPPLTLTQTPVIDPTQLVAVTQGDPSVTQIMPQTVSAETAPIGTLLGYGGGGYPFFADGQGRIYGGPDGKTPVTTDKTLLLHGKQYVWRIQPDGTSAWDPSGVPTWAPTATSVGMDGYRRFTR